MRYIRPTSSRRNPPALLAPGVDHPRRNPAALFALGVDRVRAVTKLVARDRDLEIAAPLEVFTTLPALCLLPADLFLVPALTRLDFEAIPCSSKILPALVIRFPRDMSCHRNKNPESRLILTLSGSARSNNFQSQAHTVESGVSMNASKSFWKPGISCASTIA